MEDDLKATEATIQSLGKNHDPSELQQLNEEISGVRQAYAAVLHGIEDRRIVVETILYIIQDLHQKLADVTRYVNRQDNLLAETPSAQWTAKQATEKIVQLQVG